MAENVTYKGEFATCDACSVKPGSPILCAGCLHNRQLISDLKREKSQHATACLSHFVVLLQHAGVISAEQAAQLDGICDKTKPERVLEILIGNRKKQLSIGCTNCAFSTPYGSQWEHDCSDYPKESAARG